MTDELRALIDFSKYTLAVAAGPFVYAIEKFSPAKVELMRWPLLGSCSSY